MAATWLQRCSSAQTKLPWETSGRRSPSCAKSTTQTVCRCVRFWHNGAAVQGLLYFTCAGNSKHGRMAWSTSAGVLPFTGQSKSSATAGRVVSRSAVQTVLAKTTPQASAIHDSTHVLLPPLPLLLPVCCAQFLGACTKQKPYIVITELMACSLADAFLKTFYAPTQRRQVEIALDFARGMAYLHSRRQPIVHRCEDEDLSCDWPTGSCAFLDKTG